MCRGLGNDGSVDVVVIVEHWFPKNGRVGSHPLLLACSTRSQRTAGRDRLGGGVAVFARAELKRKLHGVFVTEHSVRVRIGELTLGAVHLAPSMAESAVRKALETLQRADVAVGDFDVRWFHLEGKNTRKINTPR